MKDLIHIWLDALEKEIPCLKAGDFLRHLVKEGEARMSGLVKVWGSDASDREQNAKG